MYAMPRLYWMQSRTSEWLKMGYIIFYFCFYQNYGYNCDLKKSMFMCVCDPLCPTWLILPDSTPQLLKPKYGTELSSDRNSWDLIWKMQCQDQVKVWDHNNNNSILIYCRGKLPATSGLRALHQIKKCQQVKT